MAGKGSVIKVETVIRAHKNCGLMRPVVIGYIHLIAGQPLSTWQDPMPQPNDCLANTENSITISYFLHTRVRE